MLSAVITALLLGVMLLIIASLLVSAFLEHRRHEKHLATHSQFPTHPLDTPASWPLFITLSSSWYTRRRMFVSAGFLLMLFLALFVQGALADGALQSLGNGFSVFASYQPSEVRSSTIKTAAHPLNLTASASIVRVDSAARNQYYTDYQWHVWSYASCSGISLEEVMNAYGRNYTAAEILQEEQNMGVWNTYNGLTGGEPGMIRVANYFGFKADAHPPRTLADLIAITNKGYPVIVGIPGHILVVRGGDSNYVYLVDSAPADRTSMTHSEFLALWNGFSVLLTPQ